MRVSRLTPLLAVLPTAFAAPKQPDISNTTTLPTHFGLLVFPHFQALDVFGPMDVLNTLNMLYSSTTTMRLSILSKSLDPVSTAMTGMQGQGGFGESIVPTITFEDYLARGEKNEDEDCEDGTVAKRKSPSHDRGYMTNGTTEVDKGDIEVLIVPGGGGTRQNMTEDIAFVKELYPKLRYIISVCTGASILARAGILDGRKATTNKRSWSWVISTGPNVTWIPTARWVEDGNIFSSSGISAGIDVTYAWVGRVYGDEVAEYLSLISEYDREIDANHDPYGKIWDVPGAT
ncbi:class I glutamine amidotransferase-like protein [Cucurbitaria berberidis CBS 394.84]|uniref:Class I glutamine amidotransferase-like protein n=1 Tax=Cucurbitaria berberidis CBS 394.84 TaxID=1168544 RepID=A0A9P4LEQ1_9PLEO|nr:class I glutamine amidotransferase-like protein [Cucurbitaria berberidis CBS 394.84]KAF1852173.1 class I glutamine amidotransferase-like protein [Cucurbitaria berberidis CBS 394.84]